MSEVQQKISEQFTSEEEALIEKIGLSTFRRRQLQEMIIKREGNHGEIARALRTVISLDREITRMKHKLNKLVEARESKVEGQD